MNPVKDEKIKDAIEKQKERKKNEIKTERSNRGGTGGFLWSKKGNKERKRRT